MNHWESIAGIVVALLGLFWLRMRSCLWIWKAPLAFGAGRLFGLPLPESAAAPLLRRYRSLIFVAYVPDLFCALAAFVWLGTFGLILEQIAAAIVTRVYHQLLVIHTIRQAKWLAVQDSWQPVRSVALSLKVRRLRDHTRWSVELVLAVLTAIAVAFLIYYGQPWQDDRPSRRQIRLYAFAALMIYLQLGGLLIKHALTKWRMWLPGERTEDYLRWREAVLQYFLWWCDFLRISLAAMLVVVVIGTHLREAGHVQAFLLLALAAGAGLILLGSVGIKQQQHQLGALWKELQPLEAFIDPPRPIDRREFFLAGLCYCNADNPALLVPGPLVFAVNLANRRAYLYSAYVAGLVLLAIWCLSMHHPAPARAGDPPPSRTETDERLALSAKALRAVSAGIRELVEDNEAVGAEVLLLHHGKVVLHEAFGWADMDRRIPLTPNTIVCVRSMTKPLVGTAIQMLIDEGKLSPGDPASKYLPAFANDKSRAITIEQLLTHTAGFPLTLVNKPLSAYRGQREVADDAGRIGPDGPPGSFRYSDTDSETLAAIVSQVSGQPVDVFIKRRILDPLGMKDTYCVLGKDAPRRSRVSSNHAGSPGLWHKYWDHEAEPFFPFFLGAAALYSTTTDYARFLALWRDRGQAGGRRLLSQAAVERALRPAKPMLSPGSNAPYPTALAPLRPYYARHWMVYIPPEKTAAGALPVFGHGGSDGTLALVFPEQDLIACYFTQSRGGMSVFRFEELLAPLVGLKAPPLRARLPVEKLKPYLGSFRDAGGTKRAWVTLHGKRLRVELAGVGALLPRWPDASGRWALGETEPGVALSFDRKDAGEATGIRLWHNDKQLFHLQRSVPGRDLPSVEQVMAFRREKQGGDRIDALQSVELKGKLRVGANEVDYTILAAGTDRVTRRIRLPAGTETTIIDRKRVSKQSPGKPPEELGGLWRDEGVRINPIARMRDWRESPAAVTVAGKDRLGDEEVWIVRVECEFSPPLTRYVSTKTGLLLKEDAWVTARGIGTVPLTVRYEDYRKVAGVQLPFRWTSESRLTGKQILQFTEAIPKTGETKRRGPRK
jgi:CubicO group peptidase (beta-lactamase class C family)